jgi:hypothetical protein
MALNLLGRLRGLKRLRLSRSAPPVCETVAREIIERFAPDARRVRSIRDDPSSLTVAVGELPAGRRAPKGPWTFFDPGNEKRGAWLATSDATHLYAFFSHLVEVQGGREVKSIKKGIVRPAFVGQRPSWDLYFAQAGRMVRDLDPEAYVRQMARYGFTHLEVNALATAEGMEEGVPGEVYPRFYTYCPALDQFTESSLTQGLYPASYLKANLARMKASCELATRYGLIPSMSCFEPRSVPERFFDKYPELRGARVDHPFRSFKPRYNLAVSHPVVREHYRELLDNLLREIPSLGFLAIWSNDSGAGYEYTRSLYVGANGSAYLVREWSDEDIFTRAAADNILGFLHLLRDTGRKRNPDFRVGTRLEMFGPEREPVMKGLGQGLDVECPTLLATGWDTPYRHPRYRDTPVGPFSIFCRDFDEKEGREIAKLARRDCRTHVVHAHGPVNNFEPLLGIPAPWLTHDKLVALRAGGAKHLLHQGGVAPPASVPWNLNEEIFRRFQFDPELDIDTAVLDIAREWAGEEHAPTLVGAWRHAERAIRGYHPNPLYVLWSVWYRLLTRPLVPDIEAIPEKERAYYERHLLSTHHNPNRVDLARDVLFELMTPSVARKAVRRADRHARPAIDRAVETLEERVEAIGRRDPARALLVDQRDRLRGLRCWLTTGRNVSAWIADVHGYLDSDDRSVRRECRSRLRAMVASEIANARRLLELWHKSRVRFLAISAGEETTFLYGRKFGSQVKRKIDLMERFGDAEPHIDREIHWRVAALEGGTGS